MKVVRLDVLGGGRDGNGGERRVVSGLGVDGCCGWCWCRCYVMEVLVDSGNDKG